MKKIINFIKWFILMVIIAAVAIVVIGLVTSKNDTTSSPSAGASGLIDLAPAATQKPAEQRTAVYSDKYIEVYFESFDDFSSIDEYLGEFLYMTMTVENKTDKKILLSLTDASLNNDTMQMVMTGVPFTVLPEQKGKGTFIFPYVQTSLKSFDDVKKVSFKIRVYEDEPMKEIETTSLITIDK